MTKIKAKNRKRAQAVAVQRVVSLPPHIQDYLRLFNEYKVAFQSFLSRQDFEEAAKWSKAKANMAVAICDELTKW